MPEARRAAQAEPGGRARGRASSGRPAGGRAAAAAAPSPAGAGEFQGDGAASGADALTAGKSASVGRAGEGAGSRGQLGSSGALAAAAAARLGALFSANHVCQRQRLGGALGRAGSGKVSFIRLRIFTARRSTEICTDLLVGDSMGKKHHVGRTARVFALVVVRILGPLLCSS